MEAQPTLSFLLACKLRRYPMTAAPRCNSFESADYASPLPFVPMDAGVQPVADEIT